jgi:hypothetical protein
MRRVIATIIACSCAIGFALGFAVSPAQSGSDDEICAANDRAAVSPEQRIAACSVLVGKLKDQPQALSVVLTNLGATYL